jgi:hypothetical protein
LIHFDSVRATFPKKMNTSTLIHFDQPSQASVRPDVSRNVPPAFPAPGLV